MRSENKQNKMKRKLILPLTSSPQEHHQNQMGIWENRGTKANQCQKQQIVSGLVPWVSELSLGLTSLADLL